MADNTIPAMPIDIIFYIDSIAVWLPRHLRYDRQVYIQPNKVLREYDPEPGSLVYDSHPMKYPRPGYVVRMFLHQPTPEVFDRLLEVVPDCILTRVDMARDYLYTSKMDAWKMAQLFNLYCVKRYHRQELEVVKGTVYYGRKRSSSNLVCYADKPQRFHGSPCVHQELRFNGKQSLLRRGISGVKDLYGYNIQPLFDKYLDYYKLTDEGYEMIGRIILGKSAQRRLISVKKPFLPNRPEIVYDYTWRAVHSFLRPLAYKYVIEGVEPEWDKIPLFISVQSIVGLIRAKFPNFRIKPYLVDPFVFDEDASLAV